jgi:hypothetical protein
MAGSTGETGNRDQVHRPKGGGALNPIMAALRRLVGGVQVPKAKRYGETSTPTSSTYYSGMNEDYRWFRQDELVRKCIVTNAMFGTQEGFETVLEAEKPDDYAYVKERIDELNKAVNMDLILFTAQVKRSVCGKAGFEVVVNENGYPLRLLSLQSDKLKPDVDENWSLKGFTYDGNKEFYGPGEVLYFTNLGLEADMLGLSDVEPVRSVCQARHELLRENFPEIVRTLWAPYVILKADTRGLSNEEAEKVVETLAEVARAGKSIAVNEGVEATVVNMTPDVGGLNGLLDKLEQAIIGNFGTPRFLLGKPIENRATAYAELEAYVQGTIKSIQRYLRREMERQWYDPLTKKILQDEGSLTEPLPCVLKHRWSPVRVSDVYAMADAAAKLWGSYGSGPVGGKMEKVWELMGWDPGELEEEK